jgi:Asp-tRNA(Asn)/Glu-tRNA(Gln) amidotransferase A subunit family amidase
VTVASVKPSDTARAIQALADVYDEHARRIRPTRKEAALRLTKLSVSLAKQARRLSMSAVYYDAQTKYLAEEAARKAWEAFVNDDVVVAPEQVTAIPEIHAPDREIARLFNIKDTE